MSENTPNKVEISENILGKWQNAVDIMATVLEVPSAIITRAEPPEIEVLRSAQIKENPYKAGDKVLMAKHYCEAVVTKKSKVESLLCSRRSFVGFRT